MYVELLEKCVNWIPKSAEGEDVLMMPLRGHVNDSIAVGVNCYRETAVIN